ncbi:serine/threonine-protein kinase [Aldersonia kunmingensis]|uniref:serine/threonine-protein kinase n=1 Tax=Aldersonia kunmingensis TaxID=408066 RepID=UPI000830ED13|nr:serine/threonine-protein kinase [Aldersonia kunmingensis]
MPGEPNGETPSAIADYRIVGFLGEGNHGKFYLAQTPQRLGISAPLVAVKVFSGEISEDTYRRGVRELRAFAAVESPYLVRIYDAVLEQGFLYSMQYFPMGSLGRPQRPLSRAEVLRALEHAARAVHDLHDAGLVHGDIKPANIMLDEGGGKLSDLGLVRVLNSESTVTGMAPATSVEFIDRDLFYGGVPSRESDIYALGATINRALSGEGLYGDLPVNQPILAIRAVQAGAAQVSERLEPDVADLVRACLAPVETRLPTAAIVADRLAALQDG